MARLLRLKREFATFAHPHQLPPVAGNDGAPWRTWLLLGGRGAGKTRTGAEWIRSVAVGDSRLEGGKVMRRYPDTKGRS